MTTPAFEHDEEALDLAVRGALEDVGVHRSYARTVRALLLRSDEQWRVCCGSGCDPCVETLARAVAAARERLARADGRRAGGSAGGR
jgi:hypothetical protein